MIMQRHNSDTPLPQTQIFNTKPINLRPFYLYVTLLGFTVAGIQIGLILHYRASDVSSKERIELGNRVEAKIDKLLNKLESEKASINY